MFNHVCKHLTELFLLLYAVFTMCVSQADFCDNYKFAIYCAVLCQIIRATIKQLKGGCVHSSSSTTHRLSELLRLTLHTQLLLDLRVIVALMN